MENELRFRLTDAGTARQTGESIAAGMNKATGAVDNFTASVRKLHAEGASAAEIGKAFGYSTQTVNSMLGQTTNAVKATGDAAKKAGGDFESLGVSWGKIKNMAVGFLAYRVMWEVFNLVTDAIKGSINAAIDFELALARLKIASGASGGEIKILGAELRQLAKDIVVPVLELTKLATVISRGGIDPANLTQFTSAIAKFAEIAEIPFKEAATEIMQFMRNMREAPENIEKVTSTIFELGRASVASEVGVMRMANRLSGVLGPLGATTPQVAALAAALADLGIRAEMGASSMQSIVVKMAQAVEEGGDKLKGFAEVSGMSMEGFADLMRTNVMGAVTAFLGGLADMRTDGISLIGTLTELDIKEVRRLQTILRLTGSMEKLHEFLEKGPAAYDAGSASADAYNELLETSAKKIEAMNTAWYDLGITLMTKVAPSLAAVALGIKELIEMSASETMAKVGSLRYGTGHQSRGATGSWELDPVMGMDFTKMGPGLDATRDKIDRIGNSAGNAAPKVEALARAVANIGVHAMPGKTPTLLTESEQKIQAILAAFHKNPQPIGAAIGKDLFEFDQGSPRTAPIVVQMTEMQQIISDGWVHVSDTMRRAWAFGVSDILMRTRDWRDSLHGIFNSIKQSFFDVIGNMFSSFMMRFMNPVLNWMAGGMLGAFSGSPYSAGTSAGAVAAGAGLGTIANATRGLTGSSATAATAATAAVASISATSIVQSVLSALGLAAIAAGIGPAANWAVNIFKNNPKSSIFGGLFGGWINSLIQGNPAKEAAGEAKRDFGLNISPQTFEQFAGSLGLDKNRYEGIRKDLLSSPKWLTEQGYPAALAMDRAAGNKNASEAFLRSLETVETAWGTYNFRPAFEEWVKTGNASALNKAFEDAFSPSQALWANLPNWQTALDARSSMLVREKLKYRPAGDHGRPPGVPPADPIEPPMPEINIYMSVDGETPTKVLSKVIDGLDRNVMLPDGRSVKVAVRRNLR